MNADKSFCRKSRGHALMMVLVFLAISLSLLASVLLLTSNEASLTARNNLYNSSIAAAEAATEKVLSQLNHDFVNGSLNTNLSGYAALVPAQTDWPVQYIFSDHSGNVGKTRVLSTGPTVATNLSLQYSNLYGMASPFQVISTATPATQTNLSATVSQTIQLATIPLFQFAIFYSLDLEINPGQNMKVNGKVHSNGQLYSAPNASVTLEFQDAVTFAGSYANSRSTNDQAYSTDPASKSMPIFDVTNMPAPGSSLTLPIGTNNSAASVQQILELPPDGEDPNSAMGKQRFYNLADLIVSNSPAGITVKAGAWGNFTNIPPDLTNGTPRYSFVTNATFYDFREGKTVQSTDVDVSKLNIWITNRAARGGNSINNSLLNSFSKRGISSIYVIDKRPQSSAILDAVRAVNGAKLSTNGLTIATPLPLYVKGNYNLNNGDTTVGQTNTINTAPAALIGDAITVLSTSWQDSYASSSSLGSRTPGNTTVNAAVISGIVESVKVGGVAHYSGGVENFLRLLENWPGNTLTYNGSMVAMFGSRYATNFWQPTGNYYNAPTRRWAFDMNFLNSDRLPPITPQVKKLVRQKWQILPPS
jgi:hypothetical protein